MKKAELQRQWNKELARIKRLITQAKKQGVEFEFDPIPKQPKRLTEASVQRIKKIDINKIKKAGKTVEPEPIKLKTKKGEEQPQHKPRRIGTDEIEPRKPRKPPQLTPEQRSARAKKAAETRKQRETPEQRSARAKKAAETRRANLTPEEIAERERRKQEAYRHRLDTLKETRRLAREAEKQRLANDPEAQAELHRKRSESAKKAAQTRLAKETPEQRSERAKKAAETRAKNKEIHEQQIAPTEVTQTAKTDTQPVQGVDPLTGELLDKPKEAYSPQTADPKHEKAGKDDPLDSEQNFIDTIKAELEHAINQDVADLILEALEDAISEHEIAGDYEDWYISMNNTPVLVLDKIYGVKDDSDGERIRDNAMSLLMIIYGGYSNIPDSTKESLEFYTSEYYYPRERFAKQSKHRARRRNYEYNK